MLESSEKRYLLKEEKKNCYYFLFKTMKHPEYSILLLFLEVRIILQQTYCVNTKYDTWLIRIGHFLNAFSTFEYIRATLVGTTNFSSTEITDCLSNSDSSKYFMCNFVCT